MASAVTPIVAARRPPDGRHAADQWLQATGPALATISGDIAAFTALGDYTFRIYAFDGELMSSALVNEHRPRLLRDD